MNGKIEMEVRFLLSVVVVLLLAGPSAADEGFWTFNNFPAQKVRESYAANEKRGALARSLTFVLDAGAGDRTPTVDTLDLVRLIRSRLR